MAQGKKTTEKYDKRINIRVSSSLWHKIMLLAQEEGLSPSAWLRSNIKKVVNGGERRKESDGRKI